MSPDDDSMMKPSPTKHTAIEDKYKDNKADKDNTYEDDVDAIINPSTLSSKNHD